MFLCQTYPGSCCDLSQQGPAPALPSTLNPVELVEFGPFEASMSPGAAHIKLQRGMEVPWATYSQMCFGSPLAPAEAQVMLEPCPGTWSPPVQCQAVLASLLQCAHPQFQRALQGLLLSLQELGHTGKGGSWGWCCPSVTGMLLWHLAWAVQRLLPHQPRGPEGLEAGICSTSLGKLHHLPDLLWELGQFPAVGFVKGPVGSNAQPTSHSNKNKPRGDIFIFARVYFSVEMCWPET